MDEMPVNVYWCCLSTIAKHLYLAHIDTKKGTVLEWSLCGAGTQQEMNKNTAVPLAETLSAGFFIFTVASWMTLSSLEWVMFEARGLLGLIYAHILRPPRYSHCALTAQRGNELFNGMNNLCSLLPGLNY